MNAPMTETPSTDLLLQYLAGTLTGADAERVRAYVEASPERQGALAGLRSALRTEMLAGGPPTPHEEATARLFRAIGSDVPSTASDLGGLDTSRVGTVQSAWSRSLRARSSRAVPWVPLTSAVIGAVAGVAAVVALLNVRNTRNDSWTNGATYETQIGQRATVQLTDGTRVRLGPSTTLSLSSRFGQSERSVRLSGQALFIVTEATRAPFIVHTGAVTTRVLGTTFNIRRYPTDTAAQVVVESGRVATGGRGTPATLSAGDVAHVTDSTIALATGRGSGQFVDWEHDLLVFRGTPVPELLTTVGRWYGYEFRLADSSLSVGRVSATINVNDRAETLKILQAVLGVSMTFDGNVVVLSRRQDARDLRETPSTPMRADVRKPSMEMGK